VAAAEAEAVKLREIRRRQSQMGESYAEAMAHVGLVMPHTTLHRRLQRLEQFGVQGLVSKKRPRSSRLTPQIRGFIEGEAAADAHLSVEVIIQRVAERFNVTFKRRTINDVLHKAGLSRPVIRFSHDVQPATLRSAANPPVVEPLGAAGMAWLMIGDALTGYAAGMAATIQEVARDIPPAGPVTPDEQENRDEKGRFLSEYNAPEERRDPEVGARFESVEIKRADKDLGRLQIVHSKPETLREKLLALMALPLVTNRGHFDGARDVRGTWLEGLGGIDYMPETLAKFGRELKWAGVSGPLQECHARIWHELTKSWIGEDACCSVLYVDAVLKPLWTEHFHKCGRVPMLGRVMPCVETVMIHEGAGVPLWVRTYSGHVALVNNVLPLIDELEAAIGEGMLGRLTVIDGEMDCVALFKQFDLAHRYFITPLDRTRVKDLSAIEGLGRLIRYRDDDRIGGGDVELTDSRDKDSPPYRTRAIVLKRHKKDTFTVFGTNAPRDEFADDVLLDAYFDRWPLQEHVFRELNGVAAFNAAHGYGKQRVLNISVIDAMTRAAAQLERLEARRQDAHQQEERRTAVVHQHEVALRKTDKVIETTSEAQRQLKEAGQTHDTAYERRAAELAAARRDREIHGLRLKEAKRLHQEAQDKIATIGAQISRKKSERETLATHREIYQTDVELDQILSTLKVGFLLVLQFLIHRFFASMKIDLLTFAYHILLLPGERIRTEDTETVRFRAHRRDPEMMAALEKACAEFNVLQHRHDGRLVRFELYWPPGTRTHAT
jgi:hypothetical protein